MLLWLLMLLPLAGAALVAISPKESAKLVALGTTLVAVAVNLVALFEFDFADAGAYQMASSVDWIEPLGITLSLGVDSVSLMLISLTSLLGPICVLSSFSAITERIKTYFIWLLVLQTAMTGVFAARDLIVFYICFEFTLVPMYILISLYGSTNRAKAATKFFLYTFTGSLIALAGLVYVAWYNATQMAPTAGFESGQWSFDIDTLAVAARSMTAFEQGWVLLALLAGFAVKVPLFPVHTWLPLAHTEAPTAGSVILAGVLLKLGTYAIFRFVLPFVPDAVAEYAPLIAGLSIVGILYAGLICWVQTDVKKLVAYSSVSHLGFCVLGLVALNSTGLNGSVLYMINHGLSTGALFLLIGMIYERYHTRSMRELGGLAAKMPVWATFMVFFAMASVGLPGLNGFVGEFMCMMAAFQADSSWARAGAMGMTEGRLGPWFALVAGTGVIVAAIYILYMVGKVCFGPLREPDQHGHGDHHDEHALPVDLNAREIVTLLPLAVGCLVLGLFPTPLLDALEAPVAQVTAIYQGESDGPDGVLEKFEVVPAGSDSHQDDHHGESHASAAPVAGSTLEEATR
ncbi:MAG: NADH-quinone oxidoreductase subunit M [Planctomycetota bacterium]